MGYPWTQGDELLAHDLNAAIANSIGLSSGTLPLNGSLPMTGPLTLAGNATLSLHAVPLQQLTSTVAAAPFLPLATGGTVAGATTFSAALNYTATGGSASRSAQDRAAEVVNVKDFGALGDGATDDTSAINAALSYARAHVIGGHATVRLVFPVARYLVTGPLNFTGFTGLVGMTIEGCGAELWLRGAAAVIDCIGSRWLTFRDLTIYGDPSTTPRIGMQVGRVSSNSADFHTLINVKFWGNFSFACLYNFASETLSAYACTFDNNVTATGAYGVVLDGINHWSVTSSFVTMTNPADTRQSFNGNTFDCCTFQENGPSGNVWITNINSHTFRKCYASNVSGAIFILYQPAPSGGPPLAKNLDIDCHCETTGLQWMVQFTAAAGVTYAEVMGLTLIDYVLQAGVSALAVDAGSAITAVDIRGAKFTLSGPCPALFDVPSRYSVRAIETFINDSIWALPTYWSGPISKQTFPGTVYVPENFRVAATNGGSTVLYNNMGWVDLVPAAAIGSYAITMPPAAVHGQTVLISSTQTITTLTLTPNSGQTVSVQPGTLTANTSIQYRYDTPSSAWLCLGQSATGAGTYLPLSGGIVTGATTFSGAGTALTVTNSTTLGGTTTAAALNATGAVNVIAGGLTVGAAAASLSSMTLAAAGGVRKTVGIYTGSLATAGQRWQFGANSVAESGSNVGSDFFINAYDDSGATIGTAITISRSNLTVIHNGATQLTGAVGFQGTGAIAKPTVTGSRAGNAALTSLLASLANYGLITDSTSA